MKSFLSTKRAGSRPRTTAAAAASSRSALKGEVLGAGAPGQSRRMIGLLVIALGLTVQPLIVGKVSSQQQKPSILFILADNTGYGDIGACGGGELRGAPTPRIDQLAAEGLRLTQFLVEPTCTRRFERPGGRRHRFACRLGD